MADLNRTCLYDLHVALGARMVPFAGYEMPVQYPMGVLKEHLHCRAQAGIFDVSHMGQVILRPKSGALADAAAALEMLAPQDILGLKEGRQRYALFTNDAGGILDDLMVANRGDHLFVVVNAACKADDIAHMRAHLAGACAVEEVTDAASALLDAGDFGIYGKSREELQKDLDAEDASKAASRSKLLADDDDGDDMFASSDDEGAAPAKREQAAAGGGDDGNASGSGGGATAAPPGFVLDEKSGYYVDASTGVYYHPGHQLYFSSGRWYSWSQDKGYVEAAAPTPQPQPERKPTADEVDAMGVARLKATLTAAGGDPAKHVEKEELRTAVKRAIGLL